MRNARVGEVMAAMDRWAPAWLAEPWDRVGLFTGDPAQEAGHLWVALEVTPRLLEEAVAAGVQMILTHHPPIFTPLENLRSDNPAAACPLLAATHGIALFAAHTNLDSAIGGVNDVLAQRLGLGGLRPLQAAGTQGLVKLVTFAPPEAVDAVAAAMFAAGAGRIGDYRECAFSAPGTGSFLAPADGRPRVGEPGRRSRVEERRLETVAARADVDRVIAALLQAHPYQEPAYDVYRLDQGPAGVGLGRVGDLPEPEDGRAWVQRAARELGAPAATLAGDLPERVGRVAVVGGSGGELITAAAAAGAQVLVTGEAGHHMHEKAAAAGICLVVLGHYQTEVVIIEPWARRLERMLQEAGLAGRVRAWLDPQPPWRPVGPG